MRVHMPITKSKIRNHFHYGVWKYAVLVIAAIFFWNLLFTTTHYRTPNHLKVELYAEGYHSVENTAALDAMVAQIHEELLPEMEEVSYTLLTLDETYAPMQLMVWASAGEGDIYLLSREYFQQMAGGGAMLDLQPYIDDGTLNVEGINLAPGKVRDANTGERVQCGIPADSLGGLAERGLLTQGRFLSLLSTGENEKEAIQFLNYLLTNMRTEAP